MMLFIGKVILGYIIFRYILLRYTARFFRAMWLSDWDKGDTVYIFKTCFLQSLFSVSEGSFAHLYKCRVVKWGISECEVIIDDNDGDSEIKNGDQLYFPMHCVVRNESCRQRTRQNKMDKFMISHSSKAEERDKKLEDILKNK